MARKFFLISRLGKEYAVRVWIVKNRTSVSTNEGAEFATADQSQPGKSTPRLSLCVATVPTHVAHLAMVTSHSRDFTLNFHLVQVLLLPTSISKPIQSFAAKI